MSLPLFYLGASEPSWLGRLDVPLFVSRRRLARLQTLPRAKGIWALDSGGFSELKLYGEYRTSASQYIDEARRWRREIGGMQWCAIQDWMCEPIMLQKTGLTVQDHQWRTVLSYEELQTLAPDLPWIPVLQGWNLSDYMRCVQLYSDIGVDLEECPVVGVGSVCKRQSTAQIELILATLKREYHLNLHGFGMKQGGLVRSADLVVSADSMAWSYEARKRAIPLPECTHKAMKCNNCITYALKWRGELLADIAEAQVRKQERAQRRLFA